MIPSLALLLVAPLLLLTSLSNKRNAPTATVVPAAALADVANNLTQSARKRMKQNDTDTAFQHLTEAYAANPKTPGLMRCFEDLFRLRIRLLSEEGDASSLLTERMGLASLFEDQERHEEAAQELRIILQQAREASTTSNGGLSKQIRDKAASMMFRSLAAACSWDNVSEDSTALVASVRECIEENSNNEKKDAATLLRVPALHPFEALKWPCISLEDTTKVAHLYALRAMKSAHGDHAVTACGLQDMQKESVPLQQVFRQASSRVDSSSAQKSAKVIKLGYVSPDFTGKHPLAFLMQDVFRLHDKSRFEVYIYSLDGNHNDNSPEVNKIVKAASKWKVFPSGAASKVIASEIVADGLDILVDLCGYTGTAAIAEVMALRPAPVQISYMGFPGSSGAPFIDFLICDEIVVPPTLPSIRSRYTERLVVMPHSYFVNSHRYSVDLEHESLGQLSQVTPERYGLPKQAFVFCCHSRPDKIDPNSFRVWLRALKRLREDENRRAVPEQSNAMLWLLRSGPEMETNLRKLAKEEFDLSDDCMVFADIASRPEHLARLVLADLFLDTPAYNAHTVGCDSLYAGVPMVSLLRPDSSKEVYYSESGEEVPTQKLASRVGASLLQAAGLEEMIVSDMQEYEDLMVRCAVEREWFSTIKEGLVDSRDSCPLFDTERWVRNLEAGLFEVATRREGDQQQDIAVVDDDIR